MIKRILLAIALILISTFLISNINLTGKAVEGECSGTKTYYLCIEGDCDFVLGSSAVQRSEFIDIIDGNSCKPVSLQDNDNFVFRYTNNSAGGKVYDSNKQFLGSNINNHATANYKCYVKSDCSLSCSEYRV